MRAAALAILPTLALAACGGEGEVEVGDVKKCLESKDFQPQEQDQEASGFGTAVIVELPQQNRASINVFKSEDDAKEKEMSLSDFIQGAGGETKRNGNAIASFQKPPSEEDQAKVEDCL
jgi:hypothetical protein